jgi:hypothetical protein
MPGGAERSSISARSSKKRKRMESQAQAIGNYNIPAAATAGDDGLPAPQIDGESIEVDRHRVETTTRSGRKAKPAPRLIKAMATEISKAAANDVEGELFSYVASMFPDDDMIDYDDPLQAFKAVSDPDTLYYHEAMREDGSEQFKTSMLKELTDQFENGNFTVIHKS